MNVLIGVDDSRHSAAALELVKSMKWPSGTRFVVLSAVRPQVEAHALVDAAGSSWTRAAEQELTQEAEEFTSRVERDLQGSGLATEARVVPGDPREVLVQAVRSVGADLLVVGSHGRTGFGKLLMGSVASHVVAHAPCSVLVVKTTK
jgi:nucleotide-binding universal stress UspA family protein